ncbi:MAG TPA: chemotaxis protein [Nitrosomonas sp.]|nr:chemotaxis protein [Nitrosomonas sp.]HNP52465.1 methyl-accepting chemotaxis protein [Nitrosomonas nitrosa]
MRVNLPVTNTEYSLADDTLILSTTDSKGRITYVNQQFIEVSGFSKEELLGKAHNIVRHPDMPPEAFADLWNILKSGKPWTGLIKNRRKNGDYYWVIGNATPLIENGNVVGYLSVRTKPSRQVIEQTVPIYQQILDGTAKNLKIKNGSIVQTGFSGIVASLLRMTIEKRVAMALSLPMLLLLSAAVAGWWSAAQPAAMPWLNNFILIASVSGVLATGFMISDITRRVLNPLREAISLANVLASGDLNAQFSAKYSDEFRELFQALNQMGINLKATILDVRNCAETVRQAASEIAAGNQDLSQRTEEQASSLEETSASMEELASTVKQNVDNAQRADQLTDNASKIAAKGGHMMTDVMGTMNLINNSSKNIVGITNVIDGIAFQTNILALNAAVEAARAGEQGRGFAVVASEVRNLAQRSATAAKEIKKLIDNSVLQIDSGTKLVNKVGNTMQEILSSINNVTEIMAEISAASREQGSGIEQINQAVAQMDEVTQQNAALVEEAAASAESLENQANEVTSAISIFNVGKTARTTNTTIAQLESSKRNDSVSTAVLLDQQNWKNKKIVNSK